MDRLPHIQTSLQGFLLFTVLFCTETFSSSAAFPEAPFSHFITRSDDTLFDGDSIFRFISFNVPNLHLLEDNFPFTEENNWTLPTTFEIKDAMQSVHDGGGTVIRQYCFRIQRSHEPPFLPKHITDWHTYYEPAFLVMDTILALAPRYGIRLIIPFLEGPPWWGPKKEFARLRKRCHSFNSPEIREDYKHFVSYVLNRRNTVTGTWYKDDKAILCWETGNEMPTSTAWLHDIAAFIKSVDINHLLMDGNYGVRDAALDDPNIDIVSNHFYRKPASWIKRDLEKVNGCKAYIAGEWGWSPEKCGEVIEQIRRSGTASALIWSLRYRYRGGGFTWHKGEGLHWPGGFSRVELDGEKEILSLLRSAAFALRNIPEPPLSPPDPPHLLPIAHPSFISWQGSTRANRYTIERTTLPDTGHWIVVGDSLDETVIAYRPQFSDTSVNIGASYFYRCVAHGPGGSSAVSNTIGPVTVDRNVLIDEFLPGSPLFTRQQRTVFTDEKPWRFKYDFHRQKGKRGSYVDYSVDGSITAVRLYTFFPKKADPFTVSVFTDSTTRTVLKMKIKEIPYCCADPKDHLRLPVLFSSDTIPLSTTHLRISFPGGNAQLGRCEIEYR